MTLYVRIRRKRPLQLLCVAIILLLVLNVAMKHQNLDVTELSQSHKIVVVQYVHKELVTMTKDCNMSCFTEIAVHSANGEVCYCHPRMCSTIDSNNCCPGYYITCAANKNTARSDIPSTPLFSPANRFPPLHHGPQDVFLDVVLTRKGCTEVDDAALLSWIRYMRYAGVARFYVYDNDGIGIG